MADQFSRIGIVGSGAVGTYYGTRLALSGKHVRFLMRSDLDAVRRRASVIVHDKSGTSVLRPVEAFGRAEEIGPVDLVLVALKTTSPGARDLIAPLIGPATAILTLQNGFGADEALAGMFGGERVTGGLVFMAISRIGPGEIRCLNAGMVTVGEFGRPPADRTRALAAALGAAGFKSSIAPDLAEARWSKLVWNIPFNGLSIAEGGITTDRICADPRLSAEARALMVEVQVAAAAFGYAIEDSFIEKQFEVTPPMGPYAPSSLVDFLAGREVEVESIWGEPLRRAKAAGAAVPRLERLYGRLKAVCR
jgi:2-dehydropantoate 2-reductase